MALVLGTNCGFVTTAPTADPSGSNQFFDTQAKAVVDTSPVGAVRVTEIGWWCNTATEEANFEVGIYDHNVGDDEPEAVVGSISRTNAKGTTTGWKRATGLDISIDPETIYWIAAQLDNTLTTTDIDEGFTGLNAVRKLSQTTLPTPWGASSNFVFYMTIYAVVETAVGVTRKIKISGTFQDKPIKTKVAGTFEDKPIKIKVGGTFQDA